MRKHLAEQQLRPVAESAAEAAPAGATGAALAQEVSGESPSGSRRTDVSSASDALNVEWLKDQLPVSLARSFLDCHNQFAKSESYNAQGERPAPHTIGTMRTSLPCMAYICHWRFIQ